MYRDPLAGPITCFLLHLHNLLPLNLLVLTVEDGAIITQSLQRRRFVFLHPIFPRKYKTANQ